MANQAWKAWYRCRLCGRSYGTETLVRPMGMLDAALAEDRHVVLHKCSDKGVGVADFIGVMHDGAAPESEAKPA